MPEYTTKAIKASLVAIPPAKKAPDLNPRMMLVRRSAKKTGPIVMAKTNPEIIPLSKNMNIYDKT